jgi:ATP-dependent exoDNAse (exonuclease V) beta subunit
LIVFILYANFVFVLNNQSFTIYNASAGSGKTYTLVKEYLKILFQSKNKEPFKQILAITFTNKAVNEMKERIIETLNEFSDKTILTNPNSMFSAISDELNVDAFVLHSKSQSLLNSIIHNYAAFDISTIDKFTHKLIRTFAHDLKLPLNFEVELDQDILLTEAVDSLISKAGLDKTLTKTLVDFAIEKADDDKSWDISYDFNKIAKLLINENDLPFIETLSDKSTEDFTQLKLLLKHRIKNTENNITETANSTLTLIEECGLEYEDFSGKYLPKHFDSLRSKKYHLNFNTKWQSDLLENNSIYPRRVTPGIADIIDSIQPQLLDAFKSTKKLVFKFKFLNAIYKNITPLSVLNAIHKELNSIKTEQNKMLISEFNSIISNEIKDQPTPFIYERLGEKFKHYFIDEFQDTSVLQWENLIPLIDNSLSSANGSAMLVGDAKQAIYRWRGGEAEQFIKLFNQTVEPFQISQKVYNLPTNYRSYKEIINFNNGFFKHTASHMFNNSNYKSLYENAYQNHFLDEEGYVNLSFLDISKDDNRDECYTKEVLEIINSCIKNNFNLEDICVLVRKKKEGIAIANYLSEQNIPIISSETLLLFNAPEIVFINDVLTFLIQPKNNEIKVSILMFLASLLEIKNKHEFLVNHMSLSIDDMFLSFESKGVFIDLNDLLALSMYDAAETIVRAFNLISTSNAYIQFYLDIVLEYTQKKGTDISGFLSFIDKKKDSLSIVSPVGQDAIQIMTIHKAKGLEFPVVIFPYADLDIYSEIEPKEWFPLKKDNYEGFSSALLNFNKDFENFGDEGLHIFNQHKSQQELDNINLFYVALTRAVEQLYIISNKDISSKGIANENKYSGLLINYLQFLDLWSDHNSTYSFGNPKRKVASSNQKPLIEKQSFISTAKEDHNIKIVTNVGYLWDSKQEEAIEKGNLIHHIMSKIQTKEDIEIVINEFIEASKITKPQSQAIKSLVLQIVNHPLLTNCFNIENTIYNERDIITEHGMILRPDRVIINNHNEAVILDYKTGKEDRAHVQQLITYQDTLEMMNFKVIKKILVYINKDIQVKEI